MGGVDRTWGTYIIQHLNLCNFQTDLEYPDLYSFHRELKQASLCLAWKFMEDS